MLLGIPLMLALSMANSGAVPVTMIFAFNVALYSIVTMLLEIVRDQAERIEPLAILISHRPGHCRQPDHPRRPHRHGGRRARLRPRPGSRRTLGFIGQAGPPTALFALGASLSVREMAKGFHGPLGAAGLMTFCKLLLHPVFAWVMAVPMLGLDPFLATAAVIVAALPVGANVYIFAQHYDVAVLETSSAILISTGISMITIPLLLWLVLPGLG